MNGAKPIAPVFSLPLNLERSLFKFASACTCISPQARCIMNSAFAILKALEATIQLYWRSYAKGKRLDLVREPPLLSDLIITVPL